LICSVKGGKDRRLREVLEYRIYGFKTKKRKKKKEIINKFSLY